MASTASVESLPGQTTTSLLDDAQVIIKFIAQRYIYMYICMYMQLQCSIVTVTQCREGHRARWPFADISNRRGEVPDLSVLVNKIIRVFRHVCPLDLKVGTVVASEIIYCTTI